MFGKYISAIGLNFRSDELWLLTPQIRQHVSQRIALTPQLRQAIELLQLNNMELREFIEHEFEQNPLLELEDTVDIVSSNMPNSHSIAHSGNVIHNRTKSDRGNTFESGSRARKFHRYSTLAEIRRRF